MMFSALAYILYAYIALPILLYTITTKRVTLHPKLCPLIKCLPQLQACLHEASCKKWIHQIQECTNPNSEARQESANKFSHVQYPNDASYCTYLAFDMLTTDTALNFLECIGNSACLERATHSDRCATDKELSDALPFETVPPSVWQGQWRKLFTTGWDLWPCQWTVFSPPHSSEKLQPKDWMNWPKADNVWRMDLTWKNSAVNIKSLNQGGGGYSSVTFEMCNEMYPHETWNFSHLPPNHEVYNTSTPTATLKTRAVMWGTQAHENWYLLHYDSDTETMLIYYCAHTAAVDRFDSMAMVLQKERNEFTPLTEEYHEQYQQLAKKILGHVHGKLQRIPDCQ